MIKRRSSFKTLIFLQLIILLGTALRIFKFYNTYTLSSDQAMAFLLANRIINHNHILLVGPNTSFYNFNLLSPVYYYLITFFYFFLKNEVRVTLVFILIGIFSIPLVFLLAKEYGLSIKTALLASIFYSFSLPLIKYSRNIWEPHLTPFFVILSFYILLKSEKLKDFKLFIFSILLFFISMMYVSSFLIIPVFFLKTLKVFKNIKPKKGSSLFKLISLYSFFFLIFYLPVIIFEIQNEFPSAKALNYFPLTQTGNYIQVFLKQGYTFFFSLFPTINGLILRSLLILLLIGIYKTLEKKNRIQWLIYPIISSLLIIGFFNRDFYSHRFSSIFPFAIILIAVIVTRFLTPKSGEKQNYMMLLAGLFISFVFIFLDIKSYKNYVEQNRIPLYKTESSIADFIIKNSYGKTFSIETYTPQNKTNYNTVYYVYLIEKKSGILYPLSKNGNWIDYRLNTNANLIYLICENYPSTQTRDVCLTQFMQKYGLSSPSHPVIFSQSRILYTFKGDNI